MVIATARTDTAAPGFGVQLRVCRNHRRLSQLEFSLSAGVSQRHLSCLESGRARPSRDMVLLLAEALDLDLAARNRLLNAAGYVGEFSDRTLDADDMAPVRQALEMLLAQHEPFPAVVIDQRWNLVMANTAVDRMLAALGGADALWAATCADGPRNVLRLTFHPAGLRRHMVNADEIAPVLLARALREADNDAELGRIVDDLLGSAELPRRWRHPPADVALFPVLPLTLRMGDITLKLFTMLSSFGTPLDVTADRLRVEQFFPLDATTRAVFETLADTG